MDNMETQRLYVRPRGTSRHFFPFGDSEEAIHGSHEALHIILQYGETFGIRDDVVKRCCEMLTTEFDARMLLAQFASLHPQCRVSEGIQKLLPHMFFSILDGKFSFKPPLHIHFTQ